MKLRVKRISTGARLPAYSHPGDAGMDLFAAEEAVLGAGEVKAVPTGVKMAIPEGYVGLIWDKSGLSLQGVHRLAGVVDAGYRGEVKVVMVNLGRKPYVFKQGQKVAQMLIQPVQVVEVVDVGEDDLDETARGEGGFGSTGQF
ncbi:MAG: dUTP diphosphatase [Candidatus Aminicenantales bacterium]